jgi:PsbP-like protein
MNILKNACWFLLIYFIIGTLGCDSKDSNAKNTEANDNSSGAIIDTHSPQTMKMEETIVGAGSTTSNPNTATPSAKASVATTGIVMAKGSKTYFDKLNNVSLQYPENWIPDYNKYVAFKINSPQENEKDSIQENFFYAVVEENPPTKQVIQQQPAPTILTIDQMAIKMQKELTIESENRKECKVLSAHKFVLNGVPAYELISTGIIKGIAMKYRIIAMKLGTKQYYLYFSAEQNNFDRYQAEANMIFNSFLVK